MIRKRLSTRSLSSGFHPMCIFQMILKKWDWMHSGMKSRKVNVRLGMVHPKAPSPTHSTQFPWAMLCQKKCLKTLSKLQHENAITDTISLALFKSFSLFNSIPYCLILSKRLVEQCCHEKICRVEKDKARVAPLSNPAHGYYGPCRIAKHDPANP